MKKIYIILLIILLLFIVIFFNYYNNQNHFSKEITFENIFEYKNIDNITLKDTYIDESFGCSDIQFYLNEFFNKERQESIFLILNYDISKNEYFLSLKFSDLRDKKILNFILEGKNLYIKKNLKDIFYLNDFDKNVFYFKTSYKNINKLVLKNKLILKLIYNEKNKNIEYKAVKNFESRKNIFNFEVNHHFPYNTKNIDAYFELSKVLMKLKDKKNIKLENAIAYFYSLIKYKKVLEKNKFILSKEDMDKINLLILNIKGGKYIKNFSQITWNSFYKFEDYLNNLFDTACNKLDNLLCSIEDITYNLITDHEGKIVINFFWKKTKKVGEFVFTVK
ncbi:hypothetical protein OSSY52_21980 [Tepiditoga spiralis]|uniref:Uncharacterized protein n=1 Tax=Tepiditoga spiralis TaxID=2108365 RepID=A0A7G1GAC7_9BACT|nr:hypothetical protein [Tepiditoga spiralis]BBE32057.1 hypothetical protein OSSY52_21980 [Tepiditoga spiralis]